VEPLAPHEKIFVDESFLENDPIHGSMACQDCHGGDPEDSDWRSAHEGVVRDPSYPAESNVCAMCHADRAATYSTSLHYSLQPYKRAIEPSTPCIHARARQKSNRNRAGRAIWHSLEA